MLLADFDSSDVLPGSELESMMSELRTLEAGVIWGKEMQDRPFRSFEARLPGDPRAPRTLRTPEVGREVTCRPRFQMLVLLLVMLLLGSGE